MTQKKDSALASLKQARRAAVPLVAVETPDVPGTASLLVRGLNGETPIVIWDCVRGLEAGNDKGIEAIQDAAATAECAPEDLSMTSTNPTEALRIAMMLPPRTVLLHHNSPLFFDVPGVVQGIANLRDEFKRDTRTLIMLSDSFKLPDALRRDIVVLEDPMPTDSQLCEVITEIAAAAGFADKMESIPAELVDAVRGLSLFGAEQVLAMSATPEGFKIQEVWDRKVALVNQTEGLEMTVESAEDAPQVGGLESIRDMLSRVFNGKRAPRTVVWIDEIEKALAGAGKDGLGDSSGVSQDALGMLLRWMDGGSGRNRAVGLLLVGGPGTGKSLISSTTARQHSKPLFAVDLGSMKGSLVGESERKIRAAFAVIDGVGRGDNLVIATCNNLEQLPGALRRRFTLGTWYCDLPSLTERKIIWDIQRKAFEIDPDDPKPDDRDWTGAEIRNCCDIASRTGLSLRDAAQYVAIVAKSDPTSIKNLRRAATGRWNSASYPGKYKADVASGGPRREIA